MSARHETSSALQTLREAFGDCQRSAAWFKRSGWQPRGPASWASGIGGKGSRSPGRRRQAFGPPGPAAPRAHRGIVCSVPGVAPALPKQRAARGLLNYVLVVV